MARRSTVRWLAAVVLVLTLIFFVKSRNKAIPTRSVQQGASKASEEFVIPSLEPFPTYNPRPPESDADSLPFPTTNHSRAVVLAHTQKENINWLYERLGHVAHLERVYYTVDDPHAPFKVPKNKGHEAMPYLTFIIDRYDNLPDVTMFMHAHRFAWHNNDLLDGDAVNTIARLNTAKVLRDGYFNLRCHLDPGCPAHVHPALDLEFDEKTPEQAYIGQAWQELFPDEPIPRGLGAPCCAQFAVSKARLHSLPKARYIALRQWLLDTPIPDEISGRIFEYIWHYLWTGKHEVCPDELVCYCDGFGVCLENHNEMREWQLMRFEFDDNTRRLEKAMQASQDDRASSERAMVVVQILTSRNRWLRDELVYRQQQAWTLGNDPRLRAYVAGRPWEEGDGI